MLSHAIGCFPLSSYSIITTGNWLCVNGFQCNHSCCSVTLFFFFFLFFCGAVIFPTNTHSLILIFKVTRIWQAKSACFAVSCFQAPDCLFCFQLHHGEELAGWYNYHTIIIYSINHCFLLGRPSILFILSTFNEGKEYFFFFSMQGGRKQLYDGKGILGLCET